MTTVERTAYPRFKKTFSKRELNTTYTPTPEEIAFAQAHAYGLHPDLIYWYHSNASSI